MEFADNSVVLKKIKAGEYKVGRLEHPVPKAPEIMRRPTADLTDEEFTQVQEARAKFKEEEALYQLAIEEHAGKRNTVMQRLRLDLEAEFGVAGGEKAEKLFELCSTYSEGRLQDLYFFYNDLHVLVK